jgi:PAS domain S-box-containing protein
VLETQKNRRMDRKSSTDTLDRNENAPAESSGSDVDTSSEDLIRLVKTLPASVALLDAEFRYLAISPRWRSNYAMEDADVEGKSHFEFFEDEDAWWKSRMQTALKGEVAGGEEASIRRIGGDEMWARWEMRPWFDGEGIPGGLVFFCENRTEHREAREALQDEARRYRGIFDSMFQFMGLARPDGTLIEVNQTALDTGGLRREDVIGKKCWECYWFQQSEETRSAVQEAVSLAADGEFARVQVNAWAAGNRTISVDLSIKPITDPRGNVILLIPEARDISELKRIESVLQEERQFLAGVLDHSPAAVVACDAEGTITLFNRAAREFHGLPPEPVPAESWADHYSLFRPDGRTPLEMSEIPLYRALKGEEARDIEMVIRHESGVRRTVLATGQQLRDREGNVLGAFVVMNDITPYRKAEDKLKRREADRNALISALPDTLVRLNRDGVLLEYHPSPDFEPSVDPTTLLGKNLFEVAGETPLVRSFRDAFDAVAEGEQERFDFFYDVEVGGEMRRREARMVRSGRDVLVVVRDISARHRAQEDLRHSKHLLEGVLNSSLDGIAAFRAVRDESGAIVDFEWTMANPKACEMTGAAPGSLVGKRILEAMPGHRETGLFDAYARVVETGEPFATEVNYRADGIGAWFSLTATKMDDGCSVTFRDITAERETQEALRRSRVQLERAQAIAHVGSWVFDVTSRDITWTSELYRIYGLDPADGITFERYVSLLHPEDREWMMPIIQEAAEEGKSFDFIHRIVRPDGAERVLHGAGEAEVRDGSVVRLIGTAMDITERHHAEAELKRREEESTAIINALPDVLIGLQADGTVTRMFIPDRFFGDREFDLVGRHVRAFAGDDLAERTMAQVAEVLASGDVATFEYEIDLEGEMLWREVRVSPYSENEVLAVLRDITQRVRAERALREGEHRFRLLAENMSDLVCLHQPDGRYTYVSPSALRILEFETDDLIGRDPYDFVHPDDTDRLRRSLHAMALEGKTPPLTTYRMRKKSGAYLWVETSTRPIFDLDGVLVRLLTTTRDVTERVLAEHAMEKANRSLEQRNRELQDFAYVASHDLQEPLRKIRAFTDLLREEHSERLDEPGLYFLSRIHDAASRMARLISDLLAFSRVTTQAQPFEEVDLARVVEDVLQDLEIAIRESGAVVEVESLPRVAADPTQMRQLFQNLIGNAIKFRKPDVPPRVHIRSSRETYSRSGRPGASVWRILVNDNGIGFDEKYLDRIFTPFQRLHNRRDYAGTGMGLAICRRIIERHHGTLTAQSSPDEGSTFIVELPLRQSTDKPDLT